jgi:hypothetical protein
VSAAALRCTAPQQPSPPHCQWTAAHAPPSPCPDATAADTERKYQTYTYSNSSSQAAFIRQLFHLQSHKSLLPDIHSPFLREGNCTFQTPQHLNAARALQKVLPTSCLGCPRPTPYLMKWCTAQLSQQAHCS